jgi:hypothetical protein
MNDYGLTNHLRERYIERSNKKFEHLKKCRCQGCSRCVDLIYEIANSLQTKRTQIDMEIRSLLLTATEDRSYINNTEFVSTYYEKYGYDHQIKFMVNGSLVFVCIQNKDGQKVIPTCLYANGKIGAHHKKFKKPLTQ